MALGLATPAIAAGPKIGQPAPEFTITTYPKSKVTLCEGKSHQFHAMAR